MKKPLMVAVAVAVTALSTGSAQAARVDVDAVSQVAPPSFPTIWPAVIPATERVEDIFVQQADTEEDRPLTLSTSDSACIMGGDDPPPRVEPDRRIQRREPRFGGGVTIADQKYNRIWSFRREKLVTTGDTPTLVVLRGFYDRSTGGLRTIDTTDVVLTVLAESPRVYGFRDGRTLQVVVPVSNRGSTRDSEGRLRELGCGHARVSVSLDAPAAAATIFAELPRESGAPMKARASQLRVSVSVSRTSRDQRPWVSLATGMAR